MTKLNIHILFEEMSIKDAYLIANEEDMSLDISGICLLEGEVLDSSYLYIGESEKILPYLSKRIPLKFVIIGKFDESLLQANESKAIILPKSCSLLDVYAMLQKIIDKYDFCITEMIQAILNEQPLQKIFDIAARLLKNPFALFDSSFALILTGGKIPKDGTSRIWDIVLKNKGTPPDTIPLSMARMIDQKFAENSSPIVYHLEGEQHVTCPLFLEDRFFGSLGSAAVYAPFTPGQVSLIWLLKNIFEQALKFQYRAINMPYEIPFFIGRLLNGYDIDKNVIAFHLQKHGWNLSDSFQVLRIVFVDDTPMTNETSEKYIFHLQNLLQDCMLFPYEAGILAIRHYKKNIEDEEQVDTLKAQLERFKLRAGISLPFQDFMYLKYGYIQSKAALRIQNANTLSYFERCYTNHLMDVLAQTTSLKSLCHPKILQLWMQGSKRDREFIICLRHYLRNGRNLSATAKELFLHRNTLIYRLTRMSEELEINLFDNNLDNELVFLLMISCQIVSALITDEKNK